MSAICHCVSCSCVPCWTRATDMPNRRGVDDAADLATCKLSHGITTRALTRVSTILQPPISEHRDIRVPDQYETRT